MKRNIVKMRKGIKGFESPTGEPLIIQLSRAMHSGEPIIGGAQVTPTERKDGVQPQFNIRTDRFEIALEAYDRIAAAHLAQRDKYMNPKIEKDGTDNADNNGGTNDGIASGGPDSTEASA